MRERGGPAAPEGERERGRSCRRSAGELLRSVETVGEDVVRSRRGQAQHREFVQRRGAFGHAAAARTASAASTMATRNARLRASRADAETLIEAGGTVAGPCVCIASAASAVLEVATASSSMRAASS